MLDPLVNNILIRRDWRRLNGQWFRIPLFWYVVAAGVVQTLVCLNLSKILGRPLEEGMKDRCLYIYFTCFHAFIHFIVPVCAFRLTRRWVGGGRLDPLLLTPIPQNHFFWWLWSRTFVPCLALLLVFYFPLYVPYPWLYEIDFIGDKGNSSKAFLDIHFWNELPVNISVLVLLFLPWIKGKKRRLAIWVAAFLFLYLFPMSPAILKLFNNEWSQSLADFYSKWIKLLDDYPLMGTHAHFHPQVTLPYFVCATAWSAGLGVAAGLRTRLNFTTAMLLIVLVGPLAEWLMLHLVWLQESPGLYDPWIFLWGMLCTYTMSFGVLWMGLKWNLLLALSRKRIESK